MLDKLLNKEDVLKYVKIKGPLIPVHLVSLLKSNTTMIGAALSELASDDRVKISHMKIGGSPLYYVEEQREKLQDFYKYLNEKDRRTYDSLKENKILRDNEVTPLFRVSLRNIKDFAMPVEIEYNGKKELFWRWYLTDKQEAISLIKQILFPQNLQIQQSKSKSQEPQKQAQQNVERKAENVQKIVVEPKNVQPIEKKKVHVEELAPKVKIKKEETIIEKKEEKKQEKAEKQEKQLKQKQEETFIQPSQVQTQLSLGNAVLDSVDDKLLQKCKIFYNEKNIIIKELQIIKKNKEIAAIIIVPSNIGKIEYYCFIKDKKKLNENDLATVFLDAENKKLPALYLTTGEFSKKAQEKAALQFKNMKLISI